MRKQHSTAEGCQDGAFTKRSLSAVDDLQKRLQRGSHWQGKQSKKCGQAWQQESWT